MAATADQIRRFIGEVKIKCVKTGGVTMTNYGAYIFAENDELDLLDPATADQIRAPNYACAHTMITDPACELTVRIAAGEFVILTHKIGNPRVVREIV